MTINVNKQIWSDHIRYVLMTDNGTGSCQLNIYNDRQDFDSRACIYNLYVEAPYRNKGIGTALMQHAESLAKVTHQCDDVALAWDRKESSIAVEEWYRKHGYVPQQVTFKKKL